MFGFRRDQYDRFNNEGAYLETMDTTTDFKLVILDHVIGDRLIDIGPGSGGLMDRMEDRFPSAEIIGMDISRNVIDSLELRRQKEGHRWHAVLGDIVSLDASGRDIICRYFGTAEATSITFSSIIHEIFSYNEIDGKRFQYKSIEQALKNAFSILIPGGRIVIRDGIMTEEETAERLIRFKQPDGLPFLKRYAKDFKGRPIRYRHLSEDTVAMPVNDAMEFLYTYTWGEASYAYEVQEQFGYFTPSGYRRFIMSTLGDQAEIILFRHYLQPGYEEHLSPKIDFLSLDDTPSRLPDSTCLIVIEKRA